MKHINWIVALLLLAVPALAEDTVTDALVDVSLLNYVPVPAQAGDTLDVYVQIENTGTKTISGVSLTLQDNADFTVIGEDTRNAGTLSARSAYVARYTVRVSSDAEAGSSVLEYAIRQQGASPQEGTLDVDIEEGDQPVVIRDARLDPAQLEPGKEAILVLTVENLATTRVRDVSITLDLEDIPFVVLDGTTRKQLASIEGDSTRQVTYRLITEPDAEANVYGIPATVSYIDRSGTTQTQDETIGVRIDTPSRTSAYVDAVSWQDGALEVTLRIINSGLSEIKFVTLEVGDVDGATLPAQEQNSYVGNIDSDDWETVRLNINPDGEQVTMPITYTYQDAFNDEQVVTQQFTIDVPEQPSQGRGGLITTLIILALVIVAIVVWRKRRSKGKR